MELCNLTPHAIGVYDADGTVLLETIPPSGIVARVADSRLAVGRTYLTLGHQVPINRVVYGDVTDLPDPDGSLFIVSRVVAEAMPERDDLVFPDAVVRNEQGQIIGCRASARLW